MEAHSEKEVTVKAKESQVRVPSMEVVGHVEDDTFKASARKAEERGLGASRKAGRRDGKAR